MGSLGAPLVGGTLYEKTGYAGVFGVAFALLAVDFAMRALVVEKKVAKRYRSEEESDSDTESASASASEPESDLEPERSQCQQNDPSNDNDSRNDNNEEQPLLDRKRSTSSGESSSSTYILSPNQPSLARLAPIIPCLTNPRLLIALLVALVQAILLGSFDATIPTVANSYFDFNSQQSGLLFLPLGIFDLLLGPAFGWVIDIYGVKLVAVGSYTFLIPAFVLLRLPHAGGLNQQILYGGLLGLCGVGLAGIGAPSLVEAGAVVEKYYKANPEFFGSEGPYAQLYGLQSMVFSAGLAIGPELAGQLREAIGYGNMNAVLAGLCSVTALLCFVYLGGKPKALGGRKN